MSVYFSRHKSFLLQVLLHRNLQFQFLSVAEGNRYRCFSLFLRGDLALLVNFGNFGLVAFAFLDLDAGRNSGQYGILPHFAPN